ncbi:hypothetical protein FHS16_000723 [Paenibacillus endophyticus]|uniref:Hydrolase n=1 Tax=Paenibacillus endophyticus TaxID=1294268 RepID=A0A7W5C4S5_9BACL|nr:hypothetical protein [Paenibacillus endophyticus]MBB3150689.1 hypothetical protein [Paenibacillus endophyticus]
MTQKKFYYVSISGKRIEPEPSINDQLTVVGTSEQISELQQQLDQIQRDDEITQFRAPIPYKSADHDQATDKFNEDLIKVYHTVYELGTDETRAHIRQMNILTKLQDTDYNYPGYER